MSEFITSDERRAVRGAAWYASKWMIVAAIATATIGAASWAASVATSDVKGRGEAIKTKNSATNRIAAQERFEDMAADIEQSVQRFAVLQLAASEHHDDYTARVNATGAVTYCLDAVAKYNAEARKYTAAQFRAADLPESFDPTTTCKGA